MSFFLSLRLSANALALANNAFVSRTFEKIFFQTYMYAVFKVQSWLTFHQSFKKKIPFLLKSLVKPALSHQVSLFFSWSGGHLLSHIVSNAVPSAAWVLTVVFGMGTGVSPKRIATGKVEYLSRKFDSLDSPFHSVRLIKFLRTKFSLNSSFVSTRIR